MDDHPTASGLIPEKLNLATVGLVTVGLVTVDLVTVGLVTVGLVTVGNPKMIDEHNWQPRFPNASFPTLVYDLGETRLGLRIGH